MGQRRRRRLRLDRLLAPVIVLILLIFCCVKLVSCFSTESAPVVKKTAATAPPTEAHKFTVVLDAGHGGDTDPGCISADNTRMEKDDDLAMCLLIKQAFAAYPDVNVILTRSTDVFVTLDGRCDIANQNNADLFVAIHRNSAEVGRGVEAWISNKAGNAETVLAEALINALVSVGVSENRGVAKGYRDDPDSNYRVNSGTNCASCLLEIGFLSDAKDNQDFDAKKEQYAKAIADSLVATGKRLGMYSGGAPVGTEPAVTTTS